MIYDNEALAHCFFGDFSRAEASTKIPCKACGKNIKKPKSGYTAFLSHVDSQHNDVKESSWSDEQICPREKRDQVHREALSMDGLDEKSLTNQEKSAILRFKVDATTASATDDNEESYMDKIRTNGKHAKKINYKSMNHVSSTSNTIERLFSRAKLVITSQRRYMDPSTLEAILMLRYNRDPWDIFFVDRLVLKK